MTHGFYAHSAPQPTTANLPTIDDIIADLNQRQTTLSQYLKDATDDLASLLPIFALHAQTASRLGRLIRDKRAISGQAADGLADAIATTLDELCTILDIPEGTL